MYPRSFNSWTCSCRLTMLIVLMLRLLVYWMSIFPSVDPAAACNRYWSCAHSNRNSVTSLETIHIVAHVLRIVYIGHVDRPAVRVRSPPLAVQAHGKMGVHVSTTVLLHRDICKQLDFSLHHSRNKTTERPGQNIEASVPMFTKAASIQTVPRWRA